METSNQHDYMDEGSIDPDLMCIICNEPFEDPCCTSCDHTFCRKCIIRWMQSNNALCPTCRKSVSIDSLTSASRTIRNIIDKLRVKCNLCEQKEIQRGNFDDHISKICPKVIVYCLSAEIKCPWKGERGQLNNHLDTCTFQSLRPVLEELIADNRQLKEQVKQLREKVTDIILYSNQRLEKLIAQCQPYLKMDLHQQQLTDQDMSIVVQRAIIRTQCRMLYLQQNQITAAGVSILVVALQNNRTLEELYLGNNRLGDMGVDYLTQVLSKNNSTLKKLGLSANDITDEGAHHLAEMLKTNRTLTVLGLKENNIGDRGVQLLANALAHHNTSITDFYLDSNKLVSDASVDSLVYMFKYNQSLKELRIGGCNLSESGKARLREVVQSKSGLLWGKRYEVIF